MTEDVASKIKRARQKLGVSQKAMADLVGVSKRTIEAWEIGRRKPRGLALEALQEKLKTLLE